MESFQKSRMEAMHTAIRNRQIIIPESSKPFEVESAFGGAGLYKKHVMLEGKYVGVDEVGDEVCEHVVFIVTL